MASHKSRGVMGDTLLRQWTMLRAIPRAPRRKATAELIDHLCAEGFVFVLNRAADRDLRISCVDLFVGCKAASSVC